MGLPKCFAVAALVALAFPPSRLTGQVAGYRARLDSLFGILDSDQRMMGGVTIRKGERILYQRTLGFRDSIAGGWIRSDERTGYRVGSVTKPFTAVMIYQLVDESRLSLDATLKRFFPTLPLADTITVRDLLGHTSGLGDYSRGLDPVAPIAPDSILARIGSLPIQFRPGTQRRYNNSNYWLLGRIVELVAGSSYQVELERRIVGQAGLARTRVGGPVDPGANESRGYWFDEGHWVVERDDAIGNAGGAGWLVSTSDDLTRFLAALFGGRLMSRGSLAEMLTGFTDGTRRSGKGLSPFTIPGVTRTGYSHDGGIGAHSALVGHVVEDSLSLALTVNGHNYPQNRIFFAIWGILYGTGAALPSFASVPLSDSLAAGFVGVYSAPEYGLTMTVRRNGTGLEAMSEGQDPFPLRYVGANRFTFAPSGIMLEFAEPGDAGWGRMTLFQRRAAVPLPRIREAR